MKIPVQFGRASRDSSRWLVLLCLLVGVLAPTACVLWFMNDALASQKELTQRRAEQAYESNLDSQRRLFAERFHAGWKDRVAALDRQADDLPAPQAFEAAVRAGAADSVIILTRDGVPAYPAPLPPPSADSVEAQADWANAVRLEDSAATLDEAAAAYGKIAAAERDADLAARALQAQVRCLVRSGKKIDALRIIQAQFRDRLARATDPQGRLIAADAQLLAFRLAPQAPNPLPTLLPDYTNGMPSAQRLFLMNELRQPFPTLVAEALAARFLESENATRDDPTLRATAIPDVWRASGARTVALFRTATVIVAARKLIEGSSATATLQPGATPGQPSDWQIAVPRLDSTSAAQMRAFPYLWVGFLAIAVVAVSSLIAGQALRRQWHIARLKTDLVAAVSHELEDADFVGAAARRYLARRRKTRCCQDARVPGVDCPRKLAPEPRDRQLPEPFRASNETGKSSHSSRRVRTPWCEKRSRPRGSASTVVTWKSTSRIACRRCAPMKAPWLRSCCNLLDNAWRYTPEDKRIGVRAYREKGRVVFAVEDNGIGIAPRERKKIFRRFYQVDRRLARDAGGVGLGLSIVEFIVRAHGGSIDVKSQPGRGSTFSVAIPEAL